MENLALIHLVRRSNGLVPLQRFVASYKTHVPGVDHELILACKGYLHKRLPEDHADVLSGIPHRLCFLPDWGFDIGSYFAVARRYDFRYFCFLNSFSRLLAQGWLAHLDRHARSKGVGLIGATGSYQSFARSDEGRSFRQRCRHVAAAGTTSLMAQRAGAWVLGAMGLWQPARHFPEFPNYHLRTNGFVVSRELLLSLRVPPMLLKLSGFMFESGRNSLTRQVLARGLRALLVDRRGAAYDKEEWHCANAFRQSVQEDLMIADNQTDAYARATPLERGELSRLAWGSHARPA